MDADGVGFHCEGDDGGRGCRLLKGDGNGTDAGSWLELGRAARRGGDMTLPLWFAHNLAALVVEWRWDWLVGRRRVKKGGVGLELD